MGARTQALTKWSSRSQTLQSELNFGRFRDGGVEGLAKPDSHDKSLETLNAKGLGFVG